MNVHAVVPLVLSVVLAGCGAPTRGAFRPAGSVPPAAAAVGATPAAAPALLLQRYRHFHQVFESVLETNDPGPIAEIATGRAARHLNMIVHAQRRRGVIRRGHNVVHPRLGPVSADRAVVTDCVFTLGLWTYRSATGARVGPAPRPERSRLVTVLVPADGTWKVRSITASRESRC